MRPGDDLGLSMSFVFILDKYFYQSTSSDLLVYSAEQEVDFSRWSDFLRRAS